MKAQLVKIFEDVCDLRVIDYHLTTNKQVQIATIRVHFMDMMNSHMSDERMLKKIQEKFPECLSVMYDDTDSVGNVFKVIFNNIPTS